MKKLLLVAAFAVFAFSTTQAQQMKAGVGAAIPMGDVKDAYSFGLTADFTYFFEINEAFLVGPQASLLYYMGKDVNGFKPDDAMFLPIAASARYVIEDFFFGADLGYGIGLAPDGNDGGFFYRPKAGYNFGPVAALLSYSGVSSKRTVSTPIGSVSTTSTFSSLNLGVEFSF
ncbi:hypothetical protein [Aequorivita viscosa]|uniref:Outer membrane protein beta-barrel domain-containing protein n=1 Tax=Aequorivita viscosa TaxID=797419 RepID=A0A1M6N3Y2_9FLAO|nr:hypothetical protein [Aequorivita viscosa]SDX41546.1 hypothetical protein SAMN05216556_12916 [Aequorivita viscosa]SHJ90390.1 hypothetical protein SAMN04487908_13116 [Aequorivita viscosa]